MKIKKSYLITIIWLFLAGSGFSFALLSGMYLYLTPQLPLDKVYELRKARLQTPLRIYSTDGKLIGQFGEKRRIPVKFKDIPQQYVDALLAAEDAQFYSHNGISLKGLMRATSQLITTGRKGQGGSTITMQVAREFFLSRRKSFIRKFNEILLALKIEKALTKEEIFELYVNVIFLGKRAYGIEAAAHVYYGKSLDELSLAQLAMIAGLPQGPSTQNPIANPQKALKRRNWILGRMHKLDFIDQKELEDASVEPVTAKYHDKNLEVNAPYIAEMTRKEAIKKFGLNAYTDGYDIYTTVQGKLQKKAQQAVVNGLLSYDQRHGYRGPEQNLASDSAPLGTLADEEFSQLKESWAQALKSIPNYGGLIAAAVISVEEKQAQAILADGKEVTILWNKGLSTASEYLTENAVASRPKTAADVVSVGDVIRLKKSEEGEGGEKSTNWHLSQVPTAQAALVALSPKNGAILSLVGGFDFKQSHYNRAIQAKRQPGSNFKPFIYTSALENGMTPATIINDAPMVFQDDQLESTWRPENSSGKFYGPTRLRKALYLSRNLVSIRVMQNIGVGNTIRGMERFGFDQSSMPKDLSLALGSYALTPLEIATGYAVFANGGYKIKPYFIEKILNSEGEILFETFPETVCKNCAKDEFDHLFTDTTDPSPANEKQLSLLEEEGLMEPQDTLNTPYHLREDPFKLRLEIKKSLHLLEPQDYPRAPKVLDDRVAYLIDSMLKDVIKRGTGVKAKTLGRKDLGGKTGTTNGPVDAWFSGYNSDIVTTTWLGFDQNSPLGVREFGGSAALPIWIDYMSTALKDKPESKTSQPTGIVTVRIDPETGKRARADNPDAIFEYFREENIPELGEGSEEAGGAEVYESEETLTEELDF